MASMPDLHVRVIVETVRAKARALPVAFATALLDARLTILQCLGALSVLYGISYYSIPIALIVGGLGAIAAVEMQGNSEPKTDDRVIKAKIDQAIFKGDNPFNDPAVPINSKWLGYLDAIRKR